MLVNKEIFHTLCNSFKEKAVTLIAVSKTKPIEAIEALYALGQRDFGENYVQELVEKQAALPKDIRWHFIGHLQSNKVKFIAPFVHLIHGVDSEKLLLEINKQAAKNNRKIDCLLQMHIATEETKFGFDANELNDLLGKLTATPTMANISINGLMGMASFSNDKQLVTDEFALLASLFNKYFKKETATLSMGMSGDYTIAIEQGSNMVRIGSLLFGTRA